MGAIFFAIRAYNAIEPAQKKHKHISFLIAFQIESVFTKLKLFNIIFTFLYTFSIIKFISFNWDFVFFVNVACRLCKWAELIATSFSLHCVFGE